MNIGIVKWFDNEKGFGVISISNQSFEFENTKHSNINEIFIHVNNWKDKKDIQQNQLVQFEVIYNRSKLNAKDCKQFDESNIHILLHNLSKMK